MVLMEGPHRHINIRVHETYSGQFYRGKIYAPCPRHKNIHLEWYYYWSTFNKHCLVLLHIVLRFSYKNLAEILPETVK